jgi:hypothetical protein
MSATEGRPEPVEDEEDDFEMEEGDDEEGFDPLMSVLTTEEGDTIASILSSMKDATEKIAAAFDTQNKILIKMLSALSVDKNAER